MTRGFSTSRWPRNGVKFRHGDFPLFRGRESGKQVSAGEGWVHSAAVGQERHEYEGFGSSGYAA